MIQPLGRGVLVRRLTARDVSPGGIVLPDDAANVPREGVVVRVGLGVLLDDGTRAVPAVREGERVLFSQRAGHEETDDATGEALWLLEEDDLLMVVEGDERIGHAS